MKKSFKTLIAILLCLVSLTGCSSKKITVCYTAYPVEYILERVAGNYIDKYNLTEANAPIQQVNIVSNYEELINKADLILQIGELEPYWDIYSSQIKETEATIIDLSGLAAIYDFKRYSRGVISGNTVVIETDWYNSDKFKMTDMYTKDPVLWMNPIAMCSMARTIKDWLVENDPINSAYYESNFSTLETDLVRLDSEFSVIFNMNLAFVTITPSFGNWQKDYNVSVYPCILSRYGALPTEEQILVIEDSIKENNVKYIVKENIMTDEMVELFNRVKSDCGLSEISLSNLTFLTENDINQNKDYLTIMYDNLKVLENLK